MGPNMKIAAVPANRDLMEGCFVAKSLSCSQAHNGILGGGLYLDSQSLTYKTNKLTVDKKYRNLVLPMQEIKEIS